jgi:hypothetical protein
MLSAWFRSSSGGPPRSRRFGRGSRRAHRRVVPVRLSTAVAASAHERCSVPVRPRASVLGDQFGYEPGNGVEHLAASLASVDGAKPDPVAGRDEGVKGDAGRCDPSRRGRCRLRGRIPTRCPARRSARRPHRGPVHDFGSPHAPSNMRLPAGRWSTWSSATATYSPNWSRWSGRSKDDVSRLGRQ